MALVRLSALALVLSFACACGGCAKGESPPPKTEATGQLASASASAPTAPTAPSATPSQAASAAPPPETIVAFVGVDPGKTLKLAGAADGGVWTLGPADSWSLGLYDYVRSEGTKNIFKIPGSEREFSVPQAYARESSPEARKAWKKGDAVLVGPTRTAECGRVLEVTADGVKVAFEWSGKGETTIARPGDLLPLTGKLELGAPVAYQAKAGDEYRSSYFVYGDPKTTWLSGRSEIPTALVKAIDTTHVFKKGDKVLADTVETQGRYRPATVTAVLDGGARYELAYPNAKKGTAKFCRVTAPLP